VTDKPESPEQVAAHERRADKAGAALEAEIERVRELVQDANLELSERVQSHIEGLIDGGICTYDFHRSIAEFRDDGTCDICGKPADQHVAVLVCLPELDE